MTHKVKNLSKTQHVFGIAPGEVGELSEWQADLMCSKLKLGERLVEPKQHSPYPRKRKVKRED